MNEHDPGKVIDMEIAKRESQKKAPDTVNIEEAVEYLSSLSKFECALQLPEMAKKTGLKLPDLKNLVKQKRLELRSSEFLLAEDGLYRLDEFNQPTTRLTSPFRILGECRNEEGLGYCLILEVTNTDDFTQVKIPRAELAGDARKAVERLLGAGLVLAPIERAQKMLARYLGSVKPEISQLQVEQPGWNGETYVTPAGNIPETDISLIYGGPSLQVLDTDASGTLEEWKEHMAAKAEGNLYLVLFICLALAAILLPILRKNTFIVNLVGNSSTGKTTALRLAGSLFGSPKRIKTWRSTDNGLEGLAAAGNHACLTLDEIGQVDAKNLGKIAYMAANEHGKTRSDRNGDSRPSKSWNLTVGSTGEITFAEKMRSGGEEPRAGQEVRFIDIQIPCSTPHGVFHRLPEGYTGAKMADTINRDVTLYYGTAAPAFIAAIQSLGFNQVFVLAEEIMDLFRQRFVPQFCNGQVSRVGEYFALMAAAGELATRWNITGWPENHALEAMGQVFAQWLDDRGTVGASEEQKILRHVRLLIEQFGESRFLALHLRKDERQHIPLHQMGFWEIDDDGTVNHYVTTEVFKAEFCKGFNQKLLIQVLTDAGILQPRSKKRHSTVIRCGDWGPQRVYHLKNVLSHDIEQEEIKEDPPSETVLVDNNIGKIFEI